MASLSATQRLHRGRMRSYYSVQFASAIPGLPRKALWLGFVTKEEAATHKNLVERVLTYWSPQLQLPNPILAQLDALPPRLRGKYEALGLCRPKQPPRTLGDLITRFRQTQSVSPATLATYNQACDSLLEYIPGGTGLGAITPDRAAAWRQAIAGQLAPATCAKRTNVLKCMFRKASGWGWLGASPFENIVSGCQRNPARLHYVSAEVADKLIAAAPTPEWKAIIALGRYGGLRVPSELAVLEWTDLDTSDTKAPRLRVFAPKTRMTRVVPVRPKLLRALLELQAHAAPGQAKMFPSVVATSNLRTGFLKILRHEKIDVWPRLIQNLRASAATDWSQSFPQCDVACWLGHSPGVAQDHYLMPLGTNFQAATAC
jgi:integrase